MTHTLANRQRTHAPSLTNEQVNERVFERKNEREIERMSEQECVPERASD